MQRRVFALQGTKGNQSSVLLGLTSDTKSVIWHLSCTGISIAALALRLYSIDSYGLWFDEMASVEGELKQRPTLFLTDRFGWMKNNCKTTSTFISRCG